MLWSNLLYRRIGIGKLLGMLAGLAGFLVLPSLAPEIGTMVIWGFVAWYLTLGAMVGLAGVVNEYPFFGWHYAWWFRGSTIGAWMNFALVLIAYPTVAQISAAMFAPDSLWASPWWLVLEGAVLGLLIDGICTMAAGEGDRLRNQA